MSFLFAMTVETGRHLAEIGFLLIAIAGVWVVLAHLPPLRFAPGRTMLAGALLAAGGVLLIVAAHWGHFG